MAAEPVDTTYPVEPVPGPSMRRDRWHGAIAGSLLIAGAVLMFSGASIPFLSELGGEAWLGDPREKLDAVRRGPTAWNWANGLIAGASILTAAGLAGVTARLETGEGLATGGMIVFAIGAVSDVTSRILAMTFTQWSAAAQPDQAIAMTFDGLHGLGEGLIKVFIFLSFGSLLLYGLAGLAKGMSRLGGLLCVAAAAGIIAELLGTGIPALAYLVTAALGVWLLARRPGTPQQRGPVELP